MAIGYACKTIGVANTDMKYCLLKDATQDRLMEITKHNITALDHSIDYNINNNIRLFRISSDLIPFGSSNFNPIPWWEHFSKELKSIGQKIKDSNMRVSLHPGQYTVLNSDKTEVVNRAIEDLTYHTRILDSLGMDSTHKIILHIGGAYKDKRASANRFMDNYRMLEDSIKRRVVIENDDKVYNIQEVLEIGTQLNIPVIFDNLHNEINPSNEDKNEMEWIKLCQTTWKADGIQKIHYSQQAKLKKIGSHSDNIGIDSFLEFYQRLPDNEIDIMLEVKDKNLSCIKCINCITDELDIEMLKKEWLRYQYTILERSLSIYQEINHMLHSDEELSVVSFYRLIEQGLRCEGDIVSHTKALLKVWEHLDDLVTEKEIRTFHKNLEKYQHQQIGINTVKNQLRGLSESYQQISLLHTYYFIM